MRLRGAGTVTDSLRHCHCHHFQEHASHKRNRDALGRAIARSMYDVGSGVSGTGARSAIIKNGGRPCIRAARPPRRRCN
jgi:hypothetical protein